MPTGSSCHEERNRHVQLSFPRSHAIDGSKRPHKPLHLPDRRLSRADSSQRNRNLRLRWNALSCDSPQRPSASRRHLTVRSPARIAGTGVASRPEKPYSITDEPYPQPQHRSLNFNAIGRRIAMQPSLGKMSAYKILNWRDQPAGTIDEIVTAF